MVAQTDNILLTQLTQTLKTAQTSSGVDEAPDPCCFNTRRIALDVAATSVEDIEVTGCEAATPLDNIEVTGCEATTVSVFTFVFRRAEVLGAGSTA